jgi:PAS domain S-box-containing protein
MPGEFLSRGRGRAPPTGARDEGEFLRAIVGATPECIKVVAPNGTLLQMNPAGLRMIQAEDWACVAGACAFDLIAPEHREAWRAHHQRVCQGESLTWEFDLIGLKGVRRCMETHAVPITLADGQIGQLAITRDITARKVAESALKEVNEVLEERVAARTRELQAALERLSESERTFGLLVESVTDYAIFMLDATGRIVSWNAGAERIKGYRADEIIGQSFARFYTDEDQAVGRHANGLRTAALEGRFEDEGWRVRKDGSRFWANVVIDAVRQDGEVVGFAKITGGVAHDFNNLLMAILGSLELLRKRLPDDERMLALLDNATRGATRGAALTQRMLAFARRQELRPDVVDLPFLLGEMSGLLERSLGPLVTVDIQFPPRLPRVRTDASQLEAALLNLALNSRDAMADGGVITLSAREEQVDDGQPIDLAPGRFVRLSVADTGCGMDAQTLARATEPFFTTKGIGKGTGLGLPMVDGLVAQSGGRLVVKSEPDRGTTVELWLPVETDDAAPHANTKLADPPVTETPKRQLVVLAVDDDGLVLMNTAAMLEDLGHRAIEAGSGAEALAILEAQPAVDLVISDQAMPGMTGVELAAAVRARRPELPIILATGYAELPPGTDPSVTKLAKPFSQRALAEALRTLGL